MKIVSLNTGLPRDIEVNGQTVRTSIWKTPRDGRLRVTTLNIDGDRQSDLTVHGGRSKAVYCYPSEHYAFWRGELPDADLPWGAFGENLTLEGLLETEVCIGDRFRVGTAEFQVTQPRQPCFKLEIRHRRHDLIKRFVAASRPGFYVAVTREGEIGAGDAVQYLEHASSSMSVRDIFMLHFDDRGKHDQVRLAAGIAALAPSWKDHFQKRASGV
jgi:MOSC domain-containing protein YiiM